MRFGVRGHVRVRQSDGLVLWRAFKSGDPALAGPQSKAVLSAASTETNDQVLGTSVVESQTSTAADALQRSPIRVIREGSCWEQRHRT